MGETDPLRNSRAERSFESPPLQDVGMGDEGNRVLARVVAEQVTTPAAQKRARTMIWVGVAGLPLFALSQLASIVTRSFP